MKLKALIILLFFLISINGMGQSLHVHKRVIDLPTELQNVDFASGLQDKKGFIWLTQTKGGLIRYDNQNFKIYGVEHNIPAGGANLIYEDSEGAILIQIIWYDRNEQTIVVFDPILETTFSLEEYTGAPLPFDLSYDTEVIQNSDGSIWIQTASLDIFELNGGKFSYWGNASGTGQAQDLFKSSDGHAYTVEAGRPTPIVITAKDGGRKKIEIPEIYHFERFIEPIFIHPEKTGAFAQIDDPEKQTTHLIYCDWDGIVFLDTNLDKAMAYHTFDHKILTIYQEKGMLFDQEMNTVAKWDQPLTDPIIFFDRQGGWWSSNGRGDLKRWWAKEPKFQIYDDHLEGASKNWYRSARGIYASTNGTVYVAKGGTITKTNPDGSTQIFHTGGDYYGIRLEKGTSNLWLSQGGKASIFNMETDQFKRDYLLGDDLSTSMQTYEDKLGQIWAGCSFGIGLWNEEEQEFVRFFGYPGYELLERTRTFHFYENEQGMWVASGEGLFLIDLEAKTIERFHTEGDSTHYIPNNVIAHLQEDKDGSFWLASKGGGLIHWYPETSEFEQFTMENGLKNDVIYACYLDDFNQVWLMSDNGLMRFDKTTKQVIHYTENDGIPDREFNTISHYQDSLGQVYFGGLKGVIRFHPKDFIPKDNPYTITLTDYFKTNINDSIYSLNRSEILANHTLSILPDDKEVSLAFALLNFENSDEWEYAYQLDGLHQEWKTLEKPVVKLAALPYGNYTLHFRCKIEGYHWTSYEYPIQIKVIAPYYRRWWFWTLVIIGLAGIVWLLMRWRLAAARRREKELEGIVKDRTREISQQAEELKTLDTMKTQFFANISHELRTPLTLILGPVREMRSKRTTDIDSFELDKNLDVIDRNAERLLGLVEEVLDLSKLDAGKLTLNEESVALVDFVRYIKSNFETTAELNNIEYHLNYTVSARSYFHVDSAKLTTVLNNLLSNAFKFCGTEGMITLSLEENKESLLFRVADKGIGIKPEDIPHLFDRFYQVKSAGNIANGGTGIGLSLSKQLVELMGGTIGVDSIFGQGSTFYFEIPKKETIEKTVQLPKKSIPVETAISSPILDGEKPLALLVEDNVDMAQFIQTILGSTYAVLHSKNGEEGLRLIEENVQNIELIISDVMMPIMDGFTMLEKIKANEDWSSIPIIMLTARASEKDKLNALTIGADDYLTKPFSSPELLARIQNLRMNYENRKLWQNDLTVAVKSISDQEEVSESTKKRPDQENKKTTVSKKDLAWLKDIEKLIKKELKNESFNVQVLAQEMFLSKRQFERKIKAFTGLTPAKLVLEIRLSTGRKYLENGHYSSVSEVSYAIGIQTPSYFSKVYEKRFGRKPSSYFD